MQDQETQIVQLKKELQKGQVRISLLSVGSRTSCTPSLGTPSACMWCVHKGLSDIPFMTRAAACRTLKVHDQPVLACCVHDTLLASQNATRKAEELVNC